MRIFLTWASAAVQTRISKLLEKQKSNALTEAEESELMDYEEIDDYLSHVNRVIRNLSQSSEADLAASVTLGTSFVDSNRKAVAPGSGSSRKRRNRFAVEKIILDP